MPDPVSSRAVRPCPTPAGSLRPMFTGWLIILVCSLLLYDALLYASLRTEIRSNVRASASVAAASLKSSLTMGVRFGKNLPHSGGSTASSKRRAGPPTAAGRV